MRNIPPSDLDYELKTTNENRSRPFFTEPFALSVVPGELFARDGLIG